MRAIPKYEKVRENIREQISDGRLQPNDKLPSEEEYAKLYGVSTITIRRALADLVAEGRITRTKSKGTFVRGAGEEPPSSKLVALLLAPEDGHDVSYMQIIKGAQKIMADNDYSLIVEWGDKRLDSERAAILRMIDRKVDGLLLYPFNPTLSQENYRLLRETSIPYVQIDRYDIEAPGHFVGCNNFEGGVMATRNLLELGHRAIHFVAYRFFLSSELERYDGYCSAMRQAGVQLNAGHLLSVVDYDLLADRIRAGEITALFCCNDRLAMEVIEELLRRGVRVPQDVSIVGFDDWASNASSPVPLTTVRQNFHEIGQMAAHLLVSVINNTVQSNNIKVLTSVSLVQRGSVAPPPVAPSEDE